MREQRTPRTKTSLISCMAKFREQEKRKMHDNWAVEDHSRKMLQEQRVKTHTAARNIPAAQGSQMCSSKGAALYLPWGSQQHWLAKVGVRGPSFLPQFVTYLKGLHGFTTSHKIHWASVGTSVHVSITLCQSHLPHILTGLSPKDVPQEIIWTQICSGNSMYNGWSLLNWPSHWRWSRNRVAEGRGSCKPWGSLCVCLVWKELCHMHELTESGYFLSRHQPQWGTMVWRLQFVLRDFYYLINLYRIQWKAKWKLEFPRKSEGLFSEEGETHTTQEAGRRPRWPGSLVSKCFRSFIQCSAECHQLRIHSWIIQTGSLSQQSLASCRKWS